METLQAAQRVGLACCSGVIVGMGEETDDLIQVAKALRALEVASLPVNFFLPISGTQLSKSATAQRSMPATLSPAYCLSCPLSVSVFEPTSRDTDRSRLGNTIYGVWR